MKTVAELVENLFQKHRKPNGREYSHVEIAEALNGSIDPSSISKLRSGKIKDPRRETLLALCQFFKVPSSYFFPELNTEQEAPEEDLLALAARSHLSEEVQKKLRELIEAMKDQNQK